MVIAPTDIKWYLSGGAGNSDPTASLGGAISTTEVSATALHNIFDKVLGTESTAGDTEYRCIYVKNTHGTLTLELAKAFITNTVDPADVIDFGLDLAGKNGVADTIVDENTAPSPAVTFAAPTTYAAGTSLGDLAPGDFYAIWFRRTIASGQAAKDNVTFTPEVQGDSAE